MAITLREVSLVNPVDAYSREFFAAVAKTKEGKLFVFEKDLPETTLRSRAALAAKELGVKFTVATVRPVTEGGPVQFAVGVTQKIRKPRTPKKVDPLTPPAPSEGGGPETTPVDNAVEGDA